MVEFTAEGQVAIVAGVMIAIVGTYTLPLPALSGVATFLGATAAILAAILSHSHE